MGKKISMDIPGLPGDCTYVFPDLSEVPIGQSVYVLNSCGSYTKVTKLSEEDKGRYKFKSKTVYERPMVIQEKERIAKVADLKRKANLI